MTLSFSWSAIACTLLDLGLLFLLFLSCSFPRVDASRPLKRYWGSGPDQRLRLSVSYPIPALARRYSLLHELSYILFRALPISLEVGSQLIYAFGLYGVVLWIKFNVEIADATGLIPATIFAEQAEELYNITAAEMLNNTTDDNLSVEMIQKLATPKIVLSC
ncbi:hypothetical protein RHMOL_Rhmol07G0169700 [Rhododendron molle]|uniref:Uncharacterized protein n=1 Tax=Rhododendron molle TaxID=49168 RepID=A0ACC0N2P0_RHOML|nr:hypothetical protein RHMOL_Rhmol07G0169700 [Rhododendron molle]